MIKSKLPVIQTTLYIYIYIYSHIPLSSHPKAQIQHFMQDFSAVTT